MNEKGDKNDARKGVDPRKVLVVGHLKDVHDLGPSIYRRNLKDCHRGLYKIVEVGETPIELFRIWSVALKALSVSRTQVLRTAQVCIVLQQLPSRSKAPEVSSPFPYVYSHNSKYDKRIA